MAETTPLPPISKKPRRRSRQIVRAALLALVILLVLTAIFFLLPTWACTREGRRFALHRINSHINGKLRVRSWRLGWFSGLVLRGVTLKNRQGRVVLHCTKATTGLTLWSIMRSNYDCGTTAVHGLTLSLRRHADGRNSLDRVFSAKSGGGFASFLNHLGRTLRGVINLHDSNIQLAAQGAGGSVVFRRVGGRIEIASPDAPLRITLQGESLANRAAAPCFISGTFPPVRQWFRQPLSMLQGVQVEAADLPSAPFAAWLNLDPRIGLAFGPVLEHLTIMGRRKRNPPGLHMVPLIRAELDVSGVAGNLALRGKIVPVQARRNGYRDALLEVPRGRGYFAHATLAVVPPVAAALAYVNPLFKRLAGTSLVHASFQRVRVRMGRWDALRAAGVVHVRKAQLSPGRLCKAIAAEVHEKLPAGKHPLLRMHVSRVLISLKHGRVRCRKCQLRLGTGPDIVFRGYTTFKGALHMTMRVPVALAPLGGGTRQAPLTGTVAYPQIQPFNDEPK